jgi:hypothetical protein
MPEMPEAIKGLADTMITRFTPPSFVPGCEVKSIADVDEYTTDNGWIEAIVGGDNQQRVRYYGTPQGVSVGDYVDVEYFPAYKLYRVFGATLGGTATPGGVRVDRVWRSDFSNAAIQGGTASIQTQDSGGTAILYADLENNRIAIGGTAPTTALDVSGTITMSDILQHGGDTDTRISFEDDIIELFAGNLSMLKLTESTQDLITLGPGSGDVDIDFNGDMFLQGSSGRLGVGSGITAPNSLVELATGGVKNAGGGFADFASANTLEILFSSNSYFTSGWNVIDQTSRGSWWIDMINNTSFAVDRFSVKYRAAGAAAGAFTTYLSLDKDGLFGINGVTSPSTELDIGDGAIEFEEMTTPAAGAANTGRIFIRDDGGGDTELCFRAAAGLVQVIAPLHFAGISAEGNTTQTTISTINVKVQVTIFDTNEAANGATPDHTNDHITINKAGSYAVVGSASITSVAGAAAKFHIECYKNNGATHLSGVHTSRNLAGGGGDTGSISFSGPVDLADGDTIEVWVTNVSNTQNIIFEDINLAVYMVGVSS